MPASSKSQQRAAGAAEHMSKEDIKHAGPAVKEMAKMTNPQLHEFASGSQQGKPEHAHPKHKRGDGRSAGRDKKARGDYTK
jgi:hypothetical protein